MWDGELSSASSSDTGGEEAKQKKKKEKKEKKLARADSKSRFNLSSLSDRLDRLKKDPSSEPTAAAAPLPATGVAGAIPLRPEPRVLHGYTLTKEITFRDVCYTIRDAAFVTSDLPVIVSLEVHASLEQQETMVEIMTEAWKGMLVEFTPELAAELERGDFRHLPSPDSLKNKLLIKVKWAPGQVKSETDGVAMETPGAVDIATTDKSKALGSDTKSTTTQAAKQKPIKILQSLSNLGIYTRGYTFNQFNQAGT